MIIKGQMPSLKNSVRLNNGRVFTDPKVKDFMSKAKQEVKLQWKKEPLKALENLTCVFYHKDLRSRDIPNELDTLVDILKGIVVEDDNYACLPSIQVQYGGVDRKNPRTELWVDF